MQIQVNIVIEYDPSNSYNTIIKYQLKKRRNILMRFWKENQSLMWKHQYETVCITPWGKNALRIRATKFPVFTAHDWALEEPVPDTSADVSITIGQDEGNRNRQRRHPKRTSLHQSGCGRHYDLLPRRTENPQGIS